MKKRYNGSMNITLYTNKLRDEIINFCCSDGQCLDFLTNKYPDNRLFKDGLLASLYITNIRFMKREMGTNLTSYNDSNMNRVDYMEKVGDLLYIYDTVTLSISYNSDVEMEIPKLVIDFFKNAIIPLHENIVGEEEDFEASDDNDEKNITIRGEFSKENCKYCDKADKYKQCENYSRCRNFHNFPDISKNPIKMGDVLFVKEGNNIKAVTVNYIINSAKGEFYVDCLNDIWINKNDIGKTVFVTPR